MTMDEAGGALTSELCAFSEGAHTIVCECSLYEGADGSGPGHMGASDVARLACEVNPACLVLSHLPFYGELGELLRSVEERWPGRAVLAEEFATYAVGGA